MSAFLVCIEGMQDMIDALCSLKDALRENATLRAEVEQMRPVVEAALAMTDRYHGHAEKIPEGSNGVNDLMRAVDAYRAGEPKP